MIDLTIDELKENNRRAGQFFFSKSTMKFFGRQTFKIIETKNYGLVLRVKFGGKSSFRKDNVYYKILERGKELIKINLYSPFDDPEHNELLDEKLRNDI